MGRKRTAVGFLVMLVVAALLTMWAFSHPSQADHGSVVHNAIDKKDVTNWGAYAVIEGTAPNLNNGDWAYFRTATLDVTTKRYGEIGWWRKSTTPYYEGLIVWDDGTRDDWDFSYTSGQDGYFVVQYNNSTGDYDFFYGTSWPPSYIVSKDLKLTDDSATFVHCGGEAARDVEYMGNTRCGNGSSNGLGYLPSADAESFVRWGSHESYVEDSPYETVNIDNDNFRVKHADE